MSRETLPQRRAAETFEVEVFGLALSVTVGFFPDGRVGEVFIATRKAGTAVDIAARDAAILLSMLLQHGAAIGELARSLTRDASGRPEGLAGQVAERVAAL